MLHFGMKPILGYSPTSRTKFVPKRCEELFRLVANSMAMPWNTSEQLLGSRCSVNTWDSDGPRSMPYGRSLPVTSFPSCPMPQTSSPLPNLDLDAGPRPRHSPGSVPTGTSVPHHTPEQRSVHASFCPRREHSAPRERQ